MEKDLGTKDFSVNVRNCIISSSLQFFFFFYYYLDLDIKLGYFLKNNRCYAQINLSFNCADFLKNIKEFITYNL